MLPKFLLPIGIPGCGKSYWVAQQTGWNVVCPDLIRKEVTGDVSDISQDKKVWEITKERVIENLKDCVDTILDATNVNTPYRKRFVRDLPPCIKQAKIFECDPVVSRDRIEKDIREGKDRSNVPDWVIERMYENYLDTLTVIHEEGYEFV